MTNTLLSTVTPTKANFESMYQAYMHNSLGTMLEDLRLGVCTGTQGGSHLNSRFKLTCFWFSYMKFFIKYPRTLSNKLHVSATTTNLLSTIVVKFNTHTGAFQIHQITATFKHKHKDCANVFRWRQKQVLQKGNWRFGPWMKTIL